MVQEFNVLRCFACCAFQVDQVKKTIKKWTCKVCGEKQSIKQIFYTGNGKDCRMHVQTLNFQYRSQRSTQCNGETHCETEFCTENDKTRRANSQNYKSFVDKQLDHNCTVSRWGQFIEIQPETEIENNEEQIVEVTTNREHFQALNKAGKQKKFKTNRMRPYSSKNADCYKSLGAKPKHQQSMVTSSPMQNIQNMNHIEKCSTQSLKVNNLQMHEPQGDQGESKWGQFLTPVMDGVTSQSEDESI